MACVVMEKGFQGLTIKLRSTDPEEKRSPPY